MSFIDGKEQLAGIDDHSLVDRLNRGLAAAAAEFGALSSLTTLATALADANDILTGDFGIATKERTAKSLDTARHDFLSRAEQSINRQADTDIREMEVFGLLSGLFLEAAPDGDGRLAAIRARLRKNPGRAVPERCSGRRGKVRPRSGGLVV